MKKIILSSAIASILFGLSGCETFQDRFNPDTKVKNVIENLEKVPSKYEQTFIKKVILLI